MEGGNATGVQQSSMLGFYGEGGAEEETKHVDCRTLNKRNFCPTSVYRYTYIHIHTHTYTYIYIHIHTYTTKITYLPAYLPTYIHIYIHARTHACMHAYTHTYTHTRTHTYIHINVSRGIDTSSIPIPGSESGAAQAWCNYHRGPSFGTCPSPWLRARRHAQQVKTGEKCCLWLRLKLANSRWWN